MRKMRKLRFFVSNCIGNSRSTSLSMAKLMLVWRKSMVLSAREASNCNQRSINGDIDSQASNGQKVKNLKRWGCNLKHKGNLSSTVRSKKSPSDMKMSWRTWQLNSERQERSHNSNYQKFTDYPTWFKAMS